MLWKAIRNRISHLYLSFSLNQRQMPSSKKLSPWELYESMGSPKHIVAPMVNQSELPFRMLTRKYGATLCYTPMLHSRLFVEKPSYRTEKFSTAPEDRPLVVQLCGNDPKTVLSAALLLQDDCDAIDLNLGCPQGIARKGNYGAYLLESPDLVCEIVRTLHENLRVPVTCKIRILKSESATLELVDRLVDAGCAILTVHGRTKENNKVKVDAVDWDIIRKIKERISIPVFANGGIESYDDVEKCLKITGADGLMSSEAILEYPGIFSNTYGGDRGQIKMAMEYMEMVEKYPTSMSDVRAHLFKLLFQEVAVHTDLRQVLAKSRTEEDINEMLRTLNQRLIDTPFVGTEEGRWYLRHRKGQAKLKQAAQGEEKNLKQPQQQNQHSATENVNDINVTPSNDVITKKQKLCA